MHADAAPAPGRIASVVRDLSIWLERSAADDDLAQALRLQQAHDIVKRMPVNAVTNNLCCIFLTIAVWESVAQPLLLTWLLANGLLGALTVSKWLKVRERRWTKVRSTPLVKTCWTAALLGSLWGAMLLALLRDGLSDAEYIAVFIAAGMSAGAATGLASLPQAAMAFVLCCLLPCSLGFFLMGSLSSSAMGAATLIYAAFLLHSTWNGYRVVLELLRSHVAQGRLGLALTQSQRMMEDTFREIEDDLEVAKATQLRMLPNNTHLERLHEQTGVRVEAHFEPSMQLGGDYWGVFAHNPNVVRFCISDFSGHGLRAALNTFGMAALLTRLRSRTTSPADCMTRLNADLCPILETGQYATMLLGEIDMARGKFTYCACGSPSPMIYGAGQTQVDRLDTAGLPIGVSRSACYENTSYMLQPGKAILLFSDALVEALDDDDQVIGSAWLEELMVKHIDSFGPQGLVARIVEELRERASGRLADDLTVVVLWYAPD